jgi:hypothetical protein
LGFKIQLSLHWVVFTQPQVMQQAKSDIIAVLDDPDPTVISAPTVAVYTNRYTSAVPSQFNIFLSTLPHSSPPQD